MSVSAEEPCSAYKNGTDIFVSAGKHSDSMCLVHVQLTDGTMYVSSVTFHFGGECSCAPTVEASEFEIE